MAPSVAMLGVFVASDRRDELFSNSSDILCFCFALEQTTAQCYRGSCNRNRSQPYTGRSPKEPSPWTALSVRLARLTRV